MLRNPIDIILKDGRTLKKALEQHLAWLDDDNNKGVRLNLEGENLRNADLRGEDLEYVNLRGADLRYANLRDANLEGANLRDADLRGANLRNADIDFACMPLWCGDLKAYYDDNQIKQQLYHVLSHVKHSKNASDEIKQLLNEVNLKFANTSHVVVKHGSEKL